MSNDLSHAKCEVITVEKREIPKTEWKAFCDNFSRLHKGKQTEVESMNVEVGVQHNARNMPLMGVTAEPGSGTEPSVEIMLGDMPRAYISHTIIPSRIRVAEWNDCYSAALQIESADGWTLLLRVGPQFECLAPGMIMDDIILPPKLHSGDAPARRINRAEWASCFDGIVRHQRGKPVMVQQSSFGAGLESVVSGMPLLSITVDETREGEDPTVRIKAGDANDGTVTELVAAPSKIWVTQSDDVATALRIESETGQTVLVEFQTSDSAA